MQIAQTRRHRSWCYGITMARVSLKQYSFSSVEKQTVFVNQKQNIQILMKNWHRGNYTFAKRLGVINI